jgi:hypothetical protein
MKMSKFGMPSFLGLSNIAKGFIIPKFLARLWEFSLWEIHEPSFWLFNDYEKEIFLCDSVLGLVVSTWARSLVVGHEVEWSAVVYGCKKETTLKSPVEGGGEVELQMPLPAMSTSYAVAFLLLDARKYTESGVYVLDRAGLQLFAWQLSEKLGDGNY